MFVMPKNQQQQSSSRKKQSDNKTLCKSNMSKLIFSKLPSNNCYWAGKMTNGIGLLQDRRDVQQTAWRGMGCHGIA